MTDLSIQLRVSCGDQPIGIVSHLIFQLQDGARPTAWHTANANIEPVHGKENPTTLTYFNTRVTTKSNRKNAAEMADPSVSKFNHPTARPCTSTHHRELQLSGRQHVETLSQQPDSAPGPCDSRLVIVTFSHSAIGTISRRYCCGTTVSNTASVGRWSRA